jgi:PAS domain S-box-containing protein
MDAPHAPPRVSSPPRPDARSAAAPGHGVPPADHDLLAIVDGLDAVVWEADPATLAFTFVSHGAEALLGYPLQRWTSDLRFWHERLHPEDRDGAVAYRMDQIGARRDHDFEYRLVASDGRALYIRDRARLARDAAGALRLRGLLTNVTTRRAAENALLKSQKVLRTLVEQAPIGIGYGRGGRVLYANPAYAHMLGYADQAEVCGLESVQMVAPEEREAHAERIRRREAGLPVPEFYRVLAQRRDGTTFPIHVHAARIELPDGPANAGFITDVSEHERAQQTLRDREESMLQSQKMEAVGQLAGGVAHDFNNLLTGILGYSDLVLSELPAEHPQRGRAVEIRRAAQRGARIIERLLAFSRRQVMELRAVDLNRVITDLWDMLGRLIGEQIDVDLLPGRDLWSVRGDPVRIQQVIMNLVINARDAMPDGGRLTVATANVVVDAQHPAPVAGVAPGAYVELMVRDTGPGMDAEIQAHIFEPFFTTKEIGLGTGLGLATVYGIVSQSGGTIGVVSAPGQGSAFHVYLPTTSDPVTDPEPIAAGDAGGGTETVLVVEDDDVVRRCVCDMLTERGYRILDADSAEDALAMLDAHGGPVQLVVTDLVMPGMGGRELAARVERRHPGVKVLFISGYDPKVAGTKGGASRESVLAKPFTSDVLARRVREVLQSASAPAAAG